MINKVTAHLLFLASFSIAHAIEDHQEQPHTPPLSASNSTSHIPYDLLAQPLPETLEGPHPTALPPISDSPVPIETSTHNSPFSVLVDSILTEMTPKTKEELEACVRQLKSMWDLDGTKTFKGLYWALFKEGQKQNKELLLDLASAARKIYDVNQHLNSNLTRPEQDLLSLAKQHRPSTTPKTKNEWEVYVTNIQKACNKAFVTLYDSLNNLAKKEGQEQNKELLMNLSHAARRIFRSNKRSNPSVPHAEQDLLPLVSQQRPNTEPQASEESLMDLANAAYRIYMANQPFNPNLTLTEQNLLTLVNQHRPNTVPKNPGEWEAHVTNIQKACDKAFVTLYHSLNNLAKKEGREQNKELLMNLSHAARRIFRSNKTSNQSLTSAEPNLLTLKNQHKPNTDPQASIDLINAENSLCKTQPNKRKGEMVEEESNKRSKN